MSYWRAWRRERRDHRRIGATALLLLLLLAPASAPADPLDCARLFTPATGSSFSFAWRKDRCEGFVQQKTSYKRTSVKISYFAYGRLDREGTRRITNNTDAEIEVRGELMSTNTFYRMVARLAPGRSIEWRYPEELVAEYGLRPDKIGMLAARPGAKENVHRPFTVSDSTALSLGIFSSDFRFNSAEVKLYDGDNNELCRQTRDFSRVVALMVQQTFSIGLCGKDPAAVRRISVVAALKVPGRDGQYSSTDVIWIE
ncbi:MAG TPA: hypothetical protein VLV56_06695 [Burkholderiales bacterium]|nr:hypothetical protein [Burkholderiales bacterium]